MEVGGVLKTFFYSLVLTGAMPAAQAAGSPCDRPEGRCPLDIAPMPIDQALNQFSRQVGITVFFVDSDRALGKVSPRLRGEFTTAEALDLLLAGTGLEYTLEHGVKVSINPPAKESRTRVSTPPETRVTTASERSASTPPTSPMEQVVVEGTKNPLNGEDFQTSDGPTPHVVLPREMIAATQSRNTSDLLSAYVTATVADLHPAQTNLLQGSPSNINLRGFGPEQTLVVVDGRRQPPASPMPKGSVSPDIDGIPLSMIERIEVLPTTAASIFGSGASAGVVNIILRRDFIGNELNGRYETPDDNAANIRAFDFFHGSATRDRQLRFQLGASYSYEAALPNRERPFLVRGRQEIEAQFPGFYLRSPIVPLGSRVNIRSLSNGPLFGPGTSNITHLPDGYTTSMGLAPLLANAGSYDLSLAPSAQLGGASAGLTSSDRRFSLDMMVFYQITSAVEAFLNVAGQELRAQLATNPWYGGMQNAVVAATAPGNPFGQAIVVSVPVNGSEDSSFESEVNRYRYIAGVITDFGNDRKLTIDFTRAWSDHELASPETRSLAEAIQTGALAVLVDTSRYPLDITPWRQEWRTSPHKADNRDISIRFAGPIGRAKAGSILLKTFVQWRDEEYDGGLEQIRPATQTEFQDLNTPPQHERGAGIASAEVKLPFVAGDAPDGSDGEVRIAASYERHRVDVVPGSPEPNQPGDALRFRDDFNLWAWSAAAKYELNDFVTFRASHGTGELAPTMYQLTPAREKVFTRAVEIRDGRRAGEIIDRMTFRAGGNRDLRPEEARSTSAGLIVDPTGSRNFRIFTDVTYTERKHAILDIGQGALEDLLGFESTCPRCVVREEASAGDPFGIGKIETVNAHLRNAASMKTLAVDAAVSLATDLGRAGQLKLDSGLTWTPYLTMQLDDSSEKQHLAGYTAHYPLDLRARLRAEWTKGAWKGEWAAQYFSGYRLADGSEFLSGPGRGRVRAQQLHNLSVTYDLQGLLGVKEGTEIRAGVRNIFNSKPRVDFGEPDGYYSPITDPWLRSFSLSIRWTF